MRGFVFDILTFAFLIFIIIVSIIFGYVFIGQLKKTGMDNNLETSGLDKMKEHFKNVDGFIGLAFMIVAIILLTYAYLSNSPTPVILMFILIAMVLLSLIINLKVIMLALFDALSISEPTLKSDFPITYFIVENYVLLCSLLAFLMGGIMHIRGDTG